jgi:phosphopantetheine adenylyltransferase
MTTKETAEKQSYLSLQTKDDIIKTMTEDEIFSALEMKKRLLVDYVKTGNARC